MKILKISGFANSFPELFVNVFGVILETNIARSIKKSRMVSLELEIILGKTTV